MSLAILGYPDQARQRSQKALTLAPALSHPYSLGAGQFYATWLHYLRREWPEAQERAEAVITLATEQGFRFWLATGTILRGAGLVERGEFEAGLNVLAEALAFVEKTDERFWEAGLYRFKGELLLRQGEDEADVEACFRQAVELARRQEAKLLELQPDVVCNLQLVH